MNTLPIISIAQRKYTLHDIVFGDALAVSKLNPRHHQAHLKTLLYRITANQAAVDAMTLEERYAVFLTYLNEAKFTNLDESVVITDYLADDLNEYTRERISNELGYSLRPLTGLEAEALEVGCDNDQDWLIGEMAMTMGAPYLEPLDLDNKVLSLQFIGNLINSRIETIHKLTLEEFNVLFAQFDSLKQQQKHLIYYRFVDGVVLERINGGADDAPIRFRATAAIYGHAKDFI